MYRPSQTPLSWIHWSKGGNEEVFSLPSAEKIVDELKKWNITHLIGLPDNGTAGIYERLNADPDVDVITVTREGEAFAIAAGLYVTGKQPVVVIQSTGFLESGDAIRGTAFGMQIPLVTLIGYRGYSTMEPNSPRVADGPRVDSAATFLEPTLKAWKFPYSKLETDDDVPYISEAFEKAQATSMPAAVLLIGFWK